MAVLREPWVRSAWMFVIYTATFSLGIALAIDSGLPQFGLFDDWIVMWVGVVTMLGGILGGLAQFQGVWSFERIAIGFCLLGILTCFVAVIGNHYSDPVTLTGELSLLSIASASFGSRFYNIRGLDLNPFRQRRR